MNPKDSATVIDWPKVILCLVVAAITLALAARGGIEVWDAYGPPAEAVQAAEEKSAWLDGYITGSRDEAIASAAGKPTYEVRYDDFGNPILWRRSVVPEGLLPTPNPDTNQKQATDPPTLFPEGGESAPTPTPAPKGKPAPPKSKAS